MFVARPYVCHIRRSVAGNIPGQSRSRPRHFPHRTIENIRLDSRRDYSRDYVADLKVWGNSRQLASSDRAKVWSPVGSRLIPLRRGGTTKERTIELLFLQVRNNRL